MRRRKLRRFMRWMDSWDFELSDGLQIVEGEGKGIACGEVGVRATYDFKEGDAIAFIPKEACLTLRTTGAAKVLDDAQLAGGLGLVVALMYERSLGEASPWFPYLNLLPLRHDVLPIVWELEEIHTLLLGTELHPVVIEDRRLIEDDWRECIWPLTQLYPNQFPKQYFTLEHYFSAKTLVASRSFEVDNVHGYGMVPFADLFNHKTNGEDIHIMCEADSGLVERMVNLGKASAEEEINCLRSNRCEEPVPLDSDSHSRIGKDRRTSAILEIVLIRDVSEGSEIFNTYGELSNASLLHRHGFTEPDNPYDIVNIDFTLVMQYCTSFFSKRHVRNRVRLWRKYGCTPLRSQTTDYFEIEACGRPQTELLFLLFILYLSEEAVHAADISLYGLEAAGEDKSNLDWEVKATKTMNLPNKALDRVGRTAYKFKQEVRKLDRVFLTAKVCEGLLWLSENRDKAYGQSSLDDDIKFLRVVSPREEPKLFYALSLRISERSILKRLIGFCHEELRKHQKG